MNMHPDGYGSLNGQLEGLNNSNGDHHAAKGPEMTQLNSLQTASSQSLFRIIHKILDDSIANRKDEPEIVACLLKKLVRMIKQRSLQQAEDLRKQNDVFKTREEKYQLKMSVLKTIVTGANEENEALMDQLRHIKNKEEELQKALDNEVLHRFELETETQILKEQLKEIRALQEALDKEVASRLHLENELELLKEQFQKKEEELAKEVSCKLELENLQKEMVDFKEQLKELKVKEKELLDIRVDLEKEMEVLKQQSKEMKKVEEERARLMKLHEEEMAYMKTKHAKEETEAKEKLNSKLDRLAKRMQSVNIL